MSEAVFNEIKATLDLILEKEVKRNIVQNGSFHDNPCLKWSSQVSFVKNSE